LSVIIACCVLTYALGRLLEAVIKFSIRRSKVLAIWIDTDARSWGMEWVKRVGNEVNAKVAGGMKTFILDGAATWSGKWPMWILDARRGWNYRAPTGKEVAEVPLLQLLQPNDPGAYYHAIQVNEAKDSLEANQPRANLSFIVVVVVLGFLILAGMIGFVMYKLTTGVTAPHGGA